MLLPGLLTDLRVAREVYDFAVDATGRILSDDNLGRPVAVPETLTRWSHNRLAARQLLDFCAEERGWRWRLALAKCGKHGASAGGFSGTIGAGSGEATGAPAGP